MATSPLVNPPPNPAALATVLPDKRLEAGSSAPPRPRRFINVRRPRRSLELVTDVCDFAISAPFRAGPSWIGLFCIFNGFVFDFWFLIFLVGVSPLLALVRFLLRMAGSEEVIDNEISYFAAQPVAGGEVEAEMLAGEDSAQGCFFGCSREAVE